MADYIIYYLRDGQRMPKEEWIKLLKEDIEERNKHSTWLSNFGTVFLDIDNGHDITVNGHDYGTRMDSLYNSAFELLNDLMYEGHDDLIMDALNKLGEEELLKIVSKMDCVQTEDNKMILKDEKDWN